MHIRSATQRPILRAPKQGRDCQGAVPRELFAAVLERIQRFGAPPPLVQRG